MDARLRPVLQVEHVHHGDVDQLAVAVTTADPLLHALRVPGQVVVDEQRAELEVDALGTAFRGDQDSLFVALERLDDRRLHIGALRT